MLVVREVPRLWIAQTVVRLEFEKFHRKIEAKYGCCSSLAKLNLLIQGQQEQVWGVWNLQRVEHL